MEIGPFTVWYHFIGRISWHQSSYTLSSVTGSGHVKYMVNPFFYFYMTTWHVLTVDMSCESDMINCNGIYFSTQEKIAYFLTQQAVHLLVHFKFLRVYKVGPIPQFTGSYPYKHRILGYGL